MGELVITPLLTRLVKIDLPTDSASFRDRVADEFREACAAVGFAGASPVDAIARIEKELWRPDNDGPNEA